ncbi:MAG TPA: amidohydrolase family protein [Puia sp.]|nr:amidohydrolase family protein [Puia sp.]
MRKNLTGLLLTAWTLSATAQTPDSGTFLLHKFAQNIGKEHYALQYTAAGPQYSISFKFVDRGQPVPLKATLGVTQENEPRSLIIKGNTSRFSTINDSIQIKDKKALIRVDDSSYSKDLGSLAFPVAGYSPGTVQMLLLKYWESHGRPASIPILPTGTVQVRLDGVDENFPNQDKPLRLNRYVISGLVWGNELLWTRPDGQLVCLITNDAEGDKLEMMLQPYEDLLPTLLTRAANYGMELFTRGTTLPKAKPTAIVGGKLIDVATGTSIDNSVILLEGGLIKATGRSGELAVPKDYVVIHAEGKTILPGLWDMHAHFEQAEWGPAYLAAGVTMVRDCGNEFEYINAIQGAIDGGKGVGPHILKAGIVDGPGPMGLGVIRATTPAEGVAVVKKYKDNGFVQIKIYSSVKPDVLKAICQEAHRQGLTVTGHIPEGMTIQEGIEDGMDMVNHVQYVYSVMKTGKDRSVDVNDSANQRVFRFIKEHGTVLDPTVGVFEMVFRNTKDDITQMEPAFYSLPLPLQALFKNMGMPPATAPRFKPILESMSKIVKAMYDQGIPIVAGTDMGFPGYSLDRELELYVAAGLTPLEAIQTATLTPARVMKLDKVSGTITPGLRADLIIVEGDPLMQIRDIRNVRTVVKDGQVYDPVTLHGLAGFGK